MAIIVQSDIENVFGETNVAIWSNLDNNSTTVVSSRITEAIAYAEGRVANRLRASRYAVPLVPVSGSHDPQVVNWCAVLAGHWLYTSRPSGRDDEPNLVRSNYNRVINEMDMVVAGTEAIPYTRQERAGSAPWVG